MLVLKRTIHVLAFAWVAPFWLCYLLHQKLMGPERALPGWSHAFSLLPGITGVYLRRAFYRLVLNRVADDVVVEFGTIFSHPDTELGRSAYLGAYCVVGNAKIGNDVLIGSGVSLLNGARQHGIARLDIPIREQPGEWPQLSIGEDSWLGDRAVVMADIGKHCIIGAAAVVTKAIPDYAIAVGNPATILRFRNTAADNANTPQPSSPELH